MYVWVCVCVCGVCVFVCVCAWQLLVTQGDVWVCVCECERTAIPCGFMQSAAAGAAAESFDSGHSGRKKDEKIHKLPDIILLSINKDRERGGDREREREREG